MDLQAIYVKTAKGQEELATRAFKLPSRVRNLLVMVDGVSSGEKIVETTAGLGNSAEFFSLLVKGGFIAAAGNNAAVSQHSATGTSAPGKELVRNVSHLVTDILGPAGDSLTVRLEESRSHEEFARQVELCREVIESSAGKKKGEEFRAAVASLMSA